VTTRSTYARGLLAGLALWLFGCGGDGDASAEKAPRAERQTPIAAMEVQTRDLSRELSVSARVQAKATIELASRASGIVQSLHAEEGDRVGRGQVLARLDTTEEEAQLARARAEVAAAERRYRRATELRGAAVVSDADYDEARRALDVARSDEQLWAARVRFGRVTAPRAAVVSRRLVEPGEAVEAREPLFELMGMDDLIVRVGVSELDVVHIEPEARWRASRWRPTSGASRRRPIPSRGF
jgi:membrane fusion protein, multidrug efflux system